MTAVIGYAVRLKDGRVPIVNVSPTPREAAVNWLATSLGMYSSSDAPDNFIREVFEHYALRDSATLIEVVVTEGKPVNTAFIVESRN